MTTLLVIREFIQKFYQKYETVLNMLFRFFVGFLTFYAANRVIGYNPYLTNHYTEVILGIVLIIFPQQVLLLAVAVYLVCQVLYVSKYLALTMALFLLVLYFVYIRFLPKHGYVILAMPLLFALRIPYVAPLLLGLVSTPAAAVPIAVGVFVYYLIEVVISVIAASSADTIALYQQVVQLLIQHDKMLATIAVFAVVTMVVHIIRSRRADYAFEYAILIGTILSTLLILVTNYLLDIQSDTLAFLIGMLVSALITWLIQFFYLSLNYAGVENLQFEDEEYYYYVRAVPKMNITAAKKKVKRFNVHPSGTDEKVLAETIIGDDADDEAPDEDKAAEHDFDFTVSVDKDDFE